MGGGDTSRGLSRACLYSLAAHAPAPQVRWVRFSEFDDLLTKCQSCFCFADKEYKLPKRPAKTFTSSSGTKGDAFK